MSLPTVACWTLKPEDHVLAELEAFIRPSDRARMTKMASKGRQTEHVLGRILGRLALQHATDLPLQEIEIDYAQTGQPHGRGLAGYGLSISHTPGLIAAAAGPYPLGIDVERADRLADYGAIAPKVFHPAEIADLAAAQPEHRPRMATRLWTLKEAYAKGLGIGVGMPFAQIRLTGLEAGPITLNGGEAGWQFVLSDLGSHLAALAVCTQDTAKVTWHDAAPRLFG